jgi:hypothetical protein
MRAFGVSVFRCNVAELKTTNRALNRRLAIYQPAANEHVYQPHGSEGGGGGDDAGREGSDQHDNVGGGSLVGGASGSGSGAEGMGEGGCAHCQSAIGDVEMLTDYISTLKAEIVITKDRCEEAVGGQFSGVLASLSSGAPLSFAALRSHCWFTCLAGSGCAPGYFWSPSWHSRMPRVKSFVGIGDPKSKDIGDPKE